ncbi:ABC transporter A family member 10 isoform X3 [Zea mays]|uniref:ABC transporter A family member 7 n=1 Tax=Zea mays TaxID=4577 RepID=A0A804PIW0_MAIZE|nr:ABC transporter A family member 10 isoform X3 [Zea mays]|eukprot:XP_008645661.1 ABC transporter A family member 10 isoform X3 [Zea mays]
MGASRLEQTDALFRKNLVIQRRACKTNCCLILFPLALCSVIGGLQIAINHASSQGGGGGGGGGGATPAIRLDCSCSNVSVDENALGGIQCPDECPLPRAPKWPPVVRTPSPEYRAVQDGLFPFADLPDASCRAEGSCPATFLVTGDNHSFVGSVIDNILPTHSSSVNLSADVSALSDFVLADDGEFHQSFLQNKCSPNLTLSYPVQYGNNVVSQDVRCTEGLVLWRDSSRLINDELYGGYYQGNRNHKIDEIAAVYDFLSSDQSNFNLIISYNSTNDYGVYDESEQSIPVINQAGPVQKPNLVQVPRLANMASNAYLHLKGNGLKMPFEFVKEMPRAAIPIHDGQFDLAPYIGQLPFVWTMELLFPVILTNLVYERQNKLRIMMKMHGLGDLPYWTISYCYFLLLSLLYVLSFVLFGSALGLTFFRQNNYGMQFIFYFAYMNLQISFAFLMTTYFSSVRTATVTGYLYIFVSGLLSQFMFRPYVEDSNISRIWITLMELLPAFSLYRIVYEFSRFAQAQPENYMASSGIQWADMTNPESGLAGVLTIMAVEWLLFLLFAFYLDHFRSYKDGIRKAAALVRSRIHGNHSEAAQQQNVQLQEFRASIQLERTDVLKEREIVELISKESDRSYSVICDNLGKVYRGKDGNADKIAVRGISISMSRGQCFGVLGPNGAGKTTLINMLTGFCKPTSGTAYVQGMDIRFDMDRIYTGIGVCPQDDLLWESLTGREHLLFYGRLKKLKAAALFEAIEQSLRSMHLLAGGVADKLVGKYSGGMKRRLSVAISLIGDPKRIRWKRLTFCATGSGSSRMVACSALEALRS